MARVAGSGVHAGPTVLRDVGACRTAGHEMRRVGRRPRGSRWRGLRVGVLQRDGGGGADYALPRATSTVLQVLEDPKAMGPRFRRAYVTTAVVTLDVVVLFLLANTAAFAVSGVRRRRAAARGDDVPVIRRFGFERVSKAHPGVEREALLSLLREAEEGAGLQ